MTCQIREDQTINRDESRDVASEKDESRGVPSEKDSDMIAEAKKPVRIDELNAASVSTRSRCPPLLVRIILGAIIVVSVSALVFGIMGGGEVSLPFKELPPFPDLSDVFLIDPWGGGQNITWAWRTFRKQGLELHVVNALTEEWHVHFDQAIEDWNNGNPDALELTTSSILPPSGETCPTRMGTMVVCNGDYGNTGYQGVNEVIINNGFIVASIALMNEYYMKRASAGEKQYLMCHEIGHGFGLGHPNEIFWNFDLGTCMDYTNRPEQNQKPNEDNFKELFDVYGSVPVQGNFRKRSLTEHNGNIKNIPQYTRFLEASKDERLSLWRLVFQHDNGNGAVYQQDLGDGFTAQAYVLSYKSE